MKNKHDIPKKFQSIVHSNLIDSEEVIYQIFGRYNGEVPETYSKKAGVMTATNLRLFFCNEKEIASFNYKKIESESKKDELFKSKSLSFFYNNNKIKITSKDVETINTMFAFLSNPIYEESISFSEHFNESEILVINNSRKTQQNKVTKTNNSHKQKIARKIKETKCTCNACGNIWYYGKMEKFDNMNEKLQSASNSMSNAGSDMMCCTGCLPAAYLPRSEEKKVRDLNQCSKCGSKAVKKEVVEHVVE